jgi:GT2 family glycosyltransferase
MAHLNYSYLKLLSHTKHPVAPGYCILTKQGLFEALNGFNEKIQFGEDYDYVTRASKQGFGFVEKTYYYVDLRRTETDGLKLTLKGVANEIYRHTHGYNLENNPIKYEFGRHKKRGD